MAEIKKKKTIDVRVRDIAASGRGVGMPNWFNLPQNKAKRVKHIDICKTLAELSEKNGNYPIGYLVYFAVDKSAHKLPTFLGGYDKVDEKKAKKIFSWLKLYCKYHKNPKLFRNQDLSHALCKFYDNVSTKTEDFKAALEKMEECSKIECFKEVAKSLGM